MKASLKFREDQKPLVRAKIPLSILGLPFLSGISAGESKELCLNLSTFSEIGPSLKLSYRPNDSWNPFSLVVKTGIGLWGSPISSPMAMSVEFDLLNRGSPRFFLKFNPQIGDFFLKKTAVSSLVLPGSGFAPKIKGFADSEDEGSEIAGDNGGSELDLPGKYVGSRKTNGFSPEFQNSGGVINSLVSGVEVSAKSVVPIWNRAVVNIRWGVRFPNDLEKVLGDGKGFPVDGVSLKKLPCLVMTKIGIEHVEKTDRKGNIPASVPGNFDAAAMCCSVKQQLENLRTENGLLRNAVEELRSEIVAGKSPVVSEIVEKEREKIGARRPAGKKERTTPEITDGKAWEELSEEKS